MTSIQTFSAPVGRVLISMIFIMSGINMIFGFEGTQGYMEAMGVPGVLLPLVIILKVGGGLAIVVGWKTRVAAFALAGFSLLTALLFHANFADQTQMAMFMKNFALAGGFLFLVTHGPGAFSIDNRNGAKLVGAE